RLGVLPLLQIGIRIGRAVAAGSKGLKAGHGLLALVRLVGTCQRERQVVGGGDVVGLFGQRRAKQRDRVSVAALLQIDLTEVDGSAGVPRIALAHAQERGNRIVRSVLRASDEALQVTRLRS